MVRLGTRGARGETAEGGSPGFARATMERLTRFVLRHRWPILAGWIVVVVVAGTGSARLSALLTNRFTLPGTHTRRAELVLQNHFGQRSTGSFTVVAKSDGYATALVPAVRAAAQRAADRLPTGRLVSVTPLTADVVSAQIVSELEPADAKGHTEAMRRAISSIPGATVYVTGRRDDRPRVARAERDEALRQVELVAARPAGSGRPRPTLPARRAPSGSAGGRSLTAGFSQH